MRGLFNIQYVVFEGVVYVIEVNPRGSRTVPFLSKVTGVPMVDLAVQCALGARLGDLGYGTGLWPAQPLVAAKAPVFSMSKLTQVDTYLGPEMKSTGEVMGLGESAAEALGKALIAAGIGLPEPGAAILLSLAVRDTAEAMPLVAWLANLRYDLLATEGTAERIRQALGITVESITKKLNEGHPNVVDVIQSGRVSAVVNTVTGDRRPLRDGFYIRRAATERRIPCFTSLDTLRAALEGCAAASREPACAPSTSTARPTCPPKTFSPAVDFSRPAQGRFHFRVSSPPRDPCTRSRNRCRRQLGPDACAAPCSRLLARPSLSSAPTRPPRLTGRSKAVSSSSVTATCGSTRAVRLA